MCIEFAFKFKNKFQCKSLAHIYVSFVINKKNPTIEFCRMSDSDDQIKCIKDIIIEHREQFAFCSEADRNKKLNELIKSC